MTDSSEPIYSNLSRKRADLIVLILASQNIKCQTDKTENGFRIFVQNDKVEMALKMVELYDSENKFFRLKYHLPQIPLSSFNSFPAFILMGVLCLIHFAVRHHDVHDEFVLQYGSSALYILQGELNRVITALFLHADAGHLLGNLAGTLIFVAPLFSITGYGSGPFLLLLSGLTGNLINAYLYRTAHLSIGASTSIMGAVGLLAAWQYVNKKRQISLHSFMPACAAAILVSLLSQGEKTDVWAHILGFLSGIIYGILWFPVNKTFTHPLREFFSLIITLLLVLGAFISGFQQ